MKRPFIPILIVFLLLSTAQPILAGVPSTRQVVQLTSRFLAAEFGIPASAFEVELLHQPAMETSGPTVRYRVEGSPEQANRLGHRTLWLVAKDGARTLERAHFSANIVVELPVAVASERIQRGTVLTRDHIRLENRKLFRHHRGFYTDLTSLEGQLTTQVIPLGRVMGPGMIKNNPDVRRGEAVSVCILRGNVTLTMEGFAREDGYNGQRLRVFCPDPQHEFLGTLENSAVVRVTL